MVIASLAACALLVSSGQTPPPPRQPLLYSGNDSLRERPLLDALDAGCSGVSIQVALVNGELRVGRELRELTPERTLERLYLEPLASLAKRRGGTILKGGRSLMLLIEVKYDGEKVYQALRALLAKDPAVWSSYDGERKRTAAVDVILSGDVPREAIQADRKRWVAINGRLEDLEGREPATLIPLITASWFQNFTWIGMRAMPNEARERLRRIVQSAHARGRQIRFAVTPDMESVWRELADAQVDWIGGDDLVRLSKFLSSRR